MTSNHQKESFKIIFITGAAQGIGYATACYLAKCGHIVYGLVRESSNTSELLKAIDQIGSNLNIVYGDVIDENVLARIIDSIIEKHNRIDVLINNACNVLVGTSESCTIEEQKLSIDVNYFGAVRTQNAILPHMRRQKNGYIINLSSVSGFEAFPHLETYVATKFALEGMSESLALHALNWNIKVSLIEMGGVKTKAPTLAPTGTRKIYDTKVYDRFIKKAKQQMQDSYEKSMDPLEISKVIQNIIDSDKPQFRYQVGDFTQKAAIMRFKDANGKTTLQSKIQFLEEIGLFPM